ncbi:hypothetical protein AX16_002409 [Volvariella volvacea WC 439]|nr:hypothetical protein AX16_002409 [Volvariella volvacea WC 439]
MEVVSSVHSARQVISIANTGPNATVGNAAGLTDAEITAIFGGGFTVAGSPAVSNSLGLNIIANDVGYFADVLIGTPAQSFRLLVDSGSADTWVGTDTCVSEIGGGCGDHIFLGPDVSSSLVVTTDPFNITYRTGAVSGVKVTDNIVLADLSLDAHAFGIALNQTLDFASNGVLFDGAISAQNTATPVESLAQLRLIQSAITSYKLGRLADGNNNGAITFGGLDATAFDPNSLVTVENANSQGFWEVNLDSITIDGTDTGLSGRTAILDTSSALILCPQADAEALHQAIPGARSDGQGGFILPCTTNARIALSIGGTAFEIDSRDLSFAPLNLNDPAGECISGIAANDNDNSNQWLVGSTFLKSVYFSHDATANTVSFAKLI